MNVNGAWIIGLFALFFILSTDPLPVLADNGSEAGRSKVIGIVPLTKSGVTQNVYRNIDRIVPELKKIPSEKVVTLECSYIGLPEHERDVLKAYQIAARVEKYLRERHKLNIDLWIAAHIGKNTRQNPPSLTFSILSEDVRSIENVSQVPVGSPAE